MENNIDFKTAKVRHTELSEEIEKHNYSYYVLDAPTVDAVSYTHLTLPTTP